MENKISDIRNQIKAENPSMSDELLDLLHEYIVAIIKSETTISYEKMKEQLENDENFDRMIRGMMTDRLFANK